MSVHGRIHSAGQSDHTIRPSGRKYGREAEARVS
jgi:hypothetical protein